MTSIWQDVKFAVRSLARTPGFLLVAVLTIGLGVGANTAIFTAVNKILLAPLPYKDSAHLVRIFASTPMFKGLPLGISMGDGAEIAKRARSIDSLTMMQTDSLTMTGSGDPKSLGIMKVSGNFFEELGARPALGRLLDENDQTAGSERVAVLSDGFWRERFGADTKVVGKTLRLGEKDYQIVGVAAASFRPFYEEALWIPLAPSAKEKADHQMHMYFSVGHLRPNATVAQAQAELDTLGAAFEKEFGAPDKNWGFYVQDLQESVVGRIRPAMLILLGAVTLVLLIACANVANLLLSRGWSRQKEIALRAALGASRVRIARLLITECLVVSLVGGGVGLLFALWGVDALRAGAPKGIPRIDQLRPDWTMLVFGLVCAVICGILFGILPALEAAKLDPNTALKEGGILGTRSRSRLRDSIAVLEISLALPLLIASALLSQGLFRLLHTEPGFRTDHLVAMSVTLPEDKYSDAAKQRQFVEQVFDATRTVPGSEGVAMETVGTLSGTRAKMSGLGIKDSSGTEHSYDNISFNSVSPGFFRTMGISVIRGREFTEQDRGGAGSAPVVLVNQSLAKKLAGSQDVVGMHISGQDEKGQSNWNTEIVGVVGDVRDANLHDAAEPEIYYPILQEPATNLTLCVRSKNDPLNLISALRSRIWIVDKNLPIEAQTMDELIRTSVAQPKFGTALLNAFGILGVILALVGIYGVVSYAVSLRTREIGVRVALGAKPGDVLNLVIGHGLRLAGFGIAIGLVAALVLTKFMASLLFGIRAYDPLTFIVAPVLLAGVAIMACYIPARRAMRVDPMVVLRYE
jgi:putative ABC transport system permease protein